MLQELKGVLVPHMELLMSRGDANRVLQGQSLKETNCERGQGKHLHEIHHEPPWPSFLAAGVNSIPSSLFSALCNM